MEHRQLASIFVILLLAAAFATPALAHDPSQHATDDEILNAVAFDQKLGAQVPLDASFTDESGKVVRLGDLLSDKPVVMVFAYYECTNLCPTVLAGLTETLRGLKFDVGDQFDVVAVSIDPEETPGIAEDTELKYIRRYGRLGTDAGWHFLTGDHATIDTVTEAVGFQYAYDPEADQFAHATGLLVLTPGGRVSRYLFGLEYPARDLQLSLVEASEKKIGSPVDQLLLRCFRYDPTTGRYTPVIMNVTQIAGIAMALLVGGFMLVMFRQEREGKGVR
jgi:protein SCO1/2